MGGPIATSAWIALIVTLFFTPFGYPLSFGPAPFLVTYAIVFAIVSAVAVALVSLNRR